MRRLFVCDDENKITVEVEVGGPVLRAALESDEADDVIRCAVLMALSALIEGGEWPTAALDAMSVFMTQMKADVRMVQLV